jgi:hypothetical protein
VEAPEDWTIAEPGDLIELLPPDEDGALHISLYKREAQGPPSEAEARSLLEWFCRNKGVEVEAEVGCRPGEARASCRFEIADADVVSEWQAVVLVWAHRAVLATYNGEPATQSTMQAGDILNSIESLCPAELDA